MSREFLLASAAWALAPPLLLAVVLSTPLPPRAWALAFVLLLVGQRLGETASLQPSIDRRFFYPRVAPLDALPDSAEPYRVVGWGSAMLPNAAALWEIEDARGDNAFTLRRLVETRRLLGRPLDVSRLLVDTLEPAFLDFMNVRFALVPEGVAAPRRWREIARANGTRLLENSRVLPRAFVPRSVRIGSDPFALGEELATARRFGQRAWIEPLAPGAPATPVTRANGPGEARTRRDGLGYRIETRLERASWVTVSVAAWPGWRATIEGESLPLAYANHGFLAIRAPAGEHRIDLRYRPRSFDVGLGVSGLSALLFAAGLVALARDRRRRPSAPVSAPG